MGMNMAAQPLPQSKRIELRQRANEYLNWAAAGCPVEDEHDTYPNELWAATATPEVVLGLLNELEKLRAVLLKEN